MRFFGPLAFDAESRNLSFTFRRTELFIALVGLVLLPNLGDVGSLLGYSPGTTSTWTRDDGWTVTYANGTVSKQEGDGWTVTTGGSESEEDEDD